MSRSSITFLVLLGFAGRCGAAEADRWQKLHTRGGEVYFLDADARAAFAKSKPNALPALAKKLPAADGASFDWSKRLRPVPVKNQTSANCWAFAAVTAFEYAWQIRNGVSPGALSVQVIADRLGKDGFGSTEEAFAELVARGTCKDAVYPGGGKPGKLRAGVKTPYRAICYGTVTPAAGKVPVKLIKQALLEHGPVTSLIQLTPALHAHKGGVFAEHFVPKPGTPPATHLVVIVGWDDARGREGCWKIQNSWGPGWADKGFAWIEYGSNDVGQYTNWVRAQSIHYKLPKDAHTRAGLEAEPFTNWPNAVSPEVPPAKPPLLPAAKAAARIGERVRVRFPVVAGAWPSDDSRLDLYSEASWDRENCMLLRIAATDFAKFGANSPADLLAKTRGRVFDVTGPLQTNPTPKGERPFIEVYKPSQLKAVP